MERRLREVSTVIELNAEGVRRLMARRNMTGQDVAKRLKTTPNYWSQLVNGHRRPSPAMRVLIVDVFRGRGCTWDTLFIFSLHSEIRDV